MFWKNQGKALKHLNTVQTVKQSSGCIMLGAASITGAQHTVIGITKKEECLQTFQIQLNQSDG